MQVRRRLQPNQLRHECFNTRTDNLAERPRRLEEHLPKMKETADEFGSANANFLMGRVS